VPEEQDASRIVSVFGGNRRRSRWLLAGDTTVLNVFGRSCFDLREVECRSSEVAMTVLTVFGSVMVLVPEGADVRLSGSSFLASSDCLVAQGAARPALPPLMVTATTVLGRTKVISLPAGVEAPAKRRRRRQRRPARTWPGPTPGAWERALDADAQAAAAKILAAEEALDAPSAARADGPITAASVSPPLPPLPPPTLLDAPFDPAAFAAAAE
jgi:hypothetical protein